MANINAEIKKISELLEQKLEIPHYQRPYRWTENNVHLLLNDILLSWKQGKKSYRIGSVILNEDKELKTFHIVDGQQRITTILLLFKALNTGLFADLLENLNYNHSDSIIAIKNNYKSIQIWISENINSEKNEYLTYITKHCEFVEIKVEDLSEAFQMFDTQNGRGKELQAYNLLKAFHIRAMEVNSFDEKIECDKNWENATRFVSPSNTEIDLLNQLFSEQIYRTRIWSRKNEPGRFNKTKINEFKGFTVDKFQSISFPYQNNTLMLHIIQKYMDNMGTQVKGIVSRFKHLQIDSISPFATINQDFINGKNFFDYVLTYTEIYKHLFEYKDVHVLPEFKIFYRDFCLRYDGSKREGDKYLLELYKSLIFLVFDKFGEDGVTKFYKILYAVVYRNRLEKFQVKYASVDELPIKNEVFYIIQQAKQYSDLQPLQKMAFKDVNCRKAVVKVLEFFFEEGINVNTEDKEINLEKYKLDYANKRSEQVAN